MRLLHARTYEFENFTDETLAPRYAILSHTWSSHELTFEGLQRPTWRQELIANLKIIGCCQMALRHGLQYVWIDTICIDKSSSAELSEAINSMFKWYAGAAFCYAYMVDVPSADFPEREGSAFRGSRWFTRAWTLQELLAPREVYFYDQEWRLLGRRGREYYIEDFDGGDVLVDLGSAVADTTGIPIGYLTQSSPVSWASLAQRMSWAAERRATRKEDVAYSLMGLFGVNMAMLYGEGEKAFIRLQKEILNNCDDDSLLAWGFRTTDPRRRGRGLLAVSPADFRNCREIDPLPSTAWTSQLLTHYSMTNKGLLIERPVLALPDSMGFLLPLDCEVRSSVSYRPRILALPLAGNPRKTGSLHTSGGSKPVEMDSRHFKGCPPMKVYVDRETHRSPPGNKSNTLLLNFVRQGEFQLRESYPTSLLVVPFGSKQGRGFHSWLLTVDGDAISQAVFRFTASDGLDYLIRLQYTRGNGGPMILLDYGLTRNPGQQQPHYASLAETLLEAKGNLNGLKWATSTPDKFFSLQLNKTTTPWVLSFHAPSPKPARFILSQEVQPQADPEPGGLTKSLSFHLSQKALTFPLMEGGLSKTTKTIRDFVNSM